MRSRNGYTEEQRDEAVKLYQECPDMLVSQIADKLGISDPSTISHWVKELGLPLRINKSSGWAKSSTKSQRSKKIFTVCPNCKNRFKLRDNQRFCHICGADMTPIEVKCKKHVEAISSYCDYRLNNPHTLKHEDLVSCTKELVNLIRSSIDDFNECFNQDDVRS